MPSMPHRNDSQNLQIGYLMQNGAPDLKRVSGPQLHTTAVVEGLRKQGHLVRMVANQDHRLGWSEDLQNWFPPQYGSTYSRIFKLFESMLRRIQAELKLPFLGIFDSMHFADACHSHLLKFDVLYERHGYMGFGGVMAARWLGIPLILELNGNIIKEIDERKLPMSSFQREIGKWITIRTFLAADHMVVVSDALKQTLVNEYQIPAEHISVVLNGVDVDLFSKRYDADKVRSRFGLNDGPLVGFVGTFEPWHGVDLLVSAFREIILRFPDAQLLIVGDGHGKDKVVAHANRLGLDGEVKFLGRLPQVEVAEVLSATKVLVAPYPFEYGDIVGTPLKIMEYMAAGKGIVASTAPLHEMIEHEVTGLRVAPADPEALADGINRLLEDDHLCNSLGENAVTRAKKYSWDQIVLRLAEIFVNEIDKKKAERRHSRRKWFLG
jgi:glycosyltransferase involved in cell wall biosynthesis